MKLIIDIPDVIYNMVRNTGTYGIYRFNSVKAIANGIPLPKGHGRILDVDRLMNELETQYVIDDSYIERDIEKYVDEDAEIIIEADRESEET